MKPSQTASTSTTVFSLSTMAMTWSSTTASPDVTSHS